MPKPKSTSAPSAALAVLSDTPKLHQVQISKLQGITLQQMAHIKHLERDAGMRGVVVGILLHQIKEFVEHGQFMPWLKKNLEGAGYRQANYYMRLAAVFVEETKVKAIEIHALPADCKDLAVGNFKGEARKLMERVAKFVGERSLNEMLADYGVKDGKKLGGARAKAAGGAVPTSTQLSEMKIEEISAWLEQGRNLLVTENALQYLAPPMVRGTVDTLDKLADQVRSAAKPILK